MIQRQIIAIGDNGFRKDPSIHGLNRFILSRTQKPQPRICVIPTASGDQESYVDDFFKVFQSYDCRLSQLSLFRGETEHIEDLILSQDILYITGGNTRNLLTLWKDWGVDHFIRKAYENGTVLAGGSAGSLCWFSEGITDSIPGRFSALKCLGFLKESNCPHYDEEGRRPSYHHHILMGDVPSGYAAENGVALHFIDEQFVEAVSAYSEKNAYFVERRNGSPKEMKIPARKLT